MPKITLHLHGGKTLESEFRSWETTEYDQEVAKIQSYLNQGSGRITFEERPNGPEHMFEVDLIARVEMSKK
jgi:hypothetical protein